VEEVKMCKELKMCSIEETNDVEDVDSVAGNTVEM